MCDSLVPERDPDRLLVLGIVANAPQDLVRSLLCHLTELPVASHEITTLYATPKGEVSCFSFFFCTITYTNSAR